MQSFLERQLGQTLSQCYGGYSWDIALASDLAEDFLYDGYFGHILKIRYYAIQILVQHDLKVNKHPSQYDNEYQHTH